MIKLLNPFKSTKIVEPELQQLSGSVMEALRASAIDTALRHALNDDAFSFTAYDITLIMRESFPEVLINHGPQRDDIHRTLNEIVDAGLLQVSAGYVDTHEALIYRSAPRFDPF